MKAKLIVHYQGTSLTFALGKKYTIGRDKSCDISLEGKQLSRIHATLIWDDTLQTHLLHDGQIFGKPSTNGVFVNGHRRKIAPLKHGDRITIAALDIEYVCCCGELEDPSKLTHPGDLGDETGTV